YPTYAQVAYGSVVVLIVVFFPAGLAGPPPAGGGGVAKVGGGRAPGGAPAPRPLPPRWPGLGGAGRAPGPPGAVHPTDELPWPQGTQRRVDCGGRRRDPRNCRAERFRQDHAVQCGQWALPADQRAGPDPRSPPDWGPAAHGGEGGRGPDLPEPQTVPGIDG